MQDLNVPYMYMFIFLLQYCLANKTPQYYY